MAEVQNNKTVLVAVPQMTKEEFLQMVVDSTDGYNWPEGSIETIDPKKARLVYVWGNRYKGNAEGTWTAHVAANLEYQIDKKEYKIPGGTAYRGPLPETDFDLLVVNDNGALPYWAKNFNKMGYVSENFQPYSSVEAMGATIEGDNSGMSHTTWMKNGNAITDLYLVPLAADVARDPNIAFVALDLMSPDSLKDMPLPSSMSIPVKEVTVSSRNSVTEDPTPVLIPFYLLEFSYEGEKNFLAVMPDKNKMVNGKLPPVKEDKSEDQLVEEAVGDKIKLAKILKWGWILAVILLFIAGFLPALILLIIWFVAKWIVNKMITSARDQIGSQMYQRTKEKNNKLAQQLGVNPAGLFQTTNKVNF